MAKEKVEIAVITREFVVTDKETMNRLALKLQVRGMTFEFVAFWGSNEYELSLQACVS
jgi:hypothetical protein